MNFIERLHGAEPDHKHPHDSMSSEHRAPFWVRYYDIVTHLVTLGKTGKVHRQTVSLADLRPGDAVLDIGCGTGMLLLEAEKVVGSKGIVVGLDVEPEMIKQARRRAIKNNSQASFDIASIAQIPYLDNTYNVAFSTLMYHHLSETERQAGMVELARVLQPGGRLILVDINPSRRSILTSLPGHSRVKRHDFVRQEAAEHMREAGFTIIDTGSHPSRQLSFAIGQNGR